MTITATDVQTCANLSRLSIDETTAQAYAGSLDKILAMMDVLSHVHTDDLQPLANVHEAYQSLRPDVADGSIERADFQAIAPATQDGLYLVPQVIE